MKLLNCLVFLKLLRFFHSKLGIPAGLKGVKVELLNLVLDSNE